MKNLFTKTNSAILQIVNALVWASVMLASSSVLGDAYEQISTILICGATASILLLTGLKSKTKTSQKGDLARP